MFGEQRGRGCGWSEAKLDTGARDRRLGVKKGFLVLAVTLTFVGGCSNNKAKAVCIHNWGQRGPAFLTKAGYLIPSSGDQQKQPPDLAEHWSRSLCSGTQRRIQGTAASCAVRALVQAGCASCTHTHTHTHTHMRTHHTCARMYTHTHIGTTHIGTHAPHTQAHMQTHTTHVHVHAHTHTCTQVPHTQAHMQTHTVHVHAHTHMQAHTHTHHTHTHIHTTCKHAHALTHTLGAWSQAGGELRAALCLLEPQPPLRIY